MRDVIYYQQIIADSIVEFKKAMVQIGSLSP